MFERFTEKARRIIFFARYEASQDGSPYILGIHLLMGVAREAPQLLHRAGIPGAQVRQIHDTIVPGKLPRISVSVEVPLSSESKKALELAITAAEQCGSRTIGPEHLLYGVFRADKKLRSELERAGLTEEKLKAVLKEVPEEGGEPQMGFGEQEAVTCRSGIGYDLHRLAEGRKLIVGGIELPFEKGPVSHSDGDVLAHAICDALLGAAGLGDIGTHFPDTDPKWKGVSSLLFLEQVRKLLEERSLRIAHIDAIVITERPRLGPHFFAMREALARSLGIQPEQINLKAKTNEGADAIGRGEAIAAQAIATLEG